jgi:hypothetical protein
MEYPSTFQPYGYNLRPNADNAKLLIIFFRIVQVVLLLKLVLDLSTFFSISDGHVSGTALIAGRLFALFALIPFGLLGIFFLIWMSRAYYNLYKADLQDFNYGKNMAVIGWFIPIGNFFIPYQIIKEIHDDSQLAFREENEIYEPKKTLLIEYWWMFYFLAILSDCIAIYLAFQFLPKEIISFCTICTTTLLLLSSVYGIAMIKKIAVVEAEMMQRSFDFRQRETEDAGKQFLSGDFPPPEIPTQQ